MGHPNVHPFADLSTAHLPADERRRLDRTLFDTPVVVRGHDYGWFVHVPLDDDDWIEPHESWEHLPTLRAALGWAREQGCWWVNFDVDADTTPDLPTFCDEPSVRHLLMRAGGTFEVVTGPLPLEEMQRLVGGYIEALPHDFGENLALYGNEDGKTLRLPGNARVTSLLADVGLQPGDHIVGDVLAVGFDPDTGASADITDEQITLLIKE